MSRKQESYLGHMKDELNIIIIIDINEIKKMTPVQYRNHLFKFIA